MNIEEGKKYYVEHQGNVCIGTVVAVVVRIEEDEGGYSRVKRLTRDIDKVYATPKEAKEHVDDSKKEKALRMLERMGLTIEDLKKQRKEKE